MPGERQIIRLRARDIYDLLRGRRGFSAGASFIRPKIYRRFLLLLLLLLREKFYIFITHCEIDRKAPAACTLIRKLENADHATRRMKIIIESLEGFDLRINETKMMKWSLMSIIYVFNSHDFVSKNDPPSPSSFSCFFGVYCLMSVTYSVFVNLYMPSFLCYYFFLYHFFFSFLLDRFCIYFLILL